MLQLKVTVVRAWQPNLLIVPVSEHCCFFSEDVEIRCRLHLHLTGFLHGAFHLQVFRKVPSSCSRGEREPERGICGELGVWGWESEDKQQTLSRAGAQWCTLTRAVCALPPRCAFGCSRGHTQVSSSLLWLLLSLGGTPVPPAAPQTPVLAVPQSRGQEGARGAPLT